MSDYKFQFCVESFRSLESQLKNCLDYIPYIEANKEVLSPKFVPLIFEACSLVDSILSEMASDPGTHQNLKSHSQTHKYLSLDERTSLCLIAPVQVLQPFRSWTNTQPEWWKAYNLVKHDRLNNYKVATYSNAVLALCGLHQVMASFKDFIPGFLQLGWIDTTDVDVSVDLGSVAHLGALHPAPPSIIVESEIFASPSRENFIIWDSDDPTCFELDYDTRGLSHRIRDLMSAHWDWG